MSATLVTIDGQYPHLGFDPVPSAPDDVTAVTTALTQATGSLKESGSLLGQVEQAGSGMWEGAAGDAFRGHLDAELTKRLQTAQTSLERALGVLTDWHGHLVGAKDAASRLDAEAASARAAVDSPPRSASTRHRPSPPPAASVPLSVRRPMYGPVAPSPLQDPAVRAAIEAERTKPKPPLASLPLGDARAVELLAIHYPWQEYGFRFGRWQRETDNELVGFPLNHWVLANILQLIDLRSGMPVAELHQRGGIGERIRFAPTGRVWVCGSLGSIAALIPEGGAPSEVALGSPRHTRPHHSLLLAHQLVHGQERPAPSPYQQHEPYGKSTWLVDCPQKPTKQAGFTWRYFQADEKLDYAASDAAVREDKKLWKALQATGLQ